MGVSSANTYISRDTKYYFCYHSRAMKPTDIYASNYNLNAAADQMSEHIEKLRQAKMISTEEAQDRIAAIEEVRALTSADVAFEHRRPGTHQCQRR
jgi:hypothetical protein